MNRPLADAGRPHCDASRAHADGNRPPADANRSPALRIARPPGGSNRMHTPDEWLP